MVETSEHDVERPGPHVVVLFGANGDLAKRMIYPALAKLGAADRLPAAYAVIGTGRHDVEDYAGVIKDAVDDSDDARWRPARPSRPPTPTTAPTSPGPSRRPRGRSPRRPGSRSPTCAAWSTCPCRPAR